MLSYERYSFSSSLDSAKNILFLTVLTLALKKNINALTTFDKLSSAESVGQILTNLAQNIT